MHTYTHTHTHTRALTHTRTCALTRTHTHSFLGFTLPYIYFISILRFLYLLLFKIRVWWNILFHITLFHFKYLKVKFVILFIMKFIFVVFYLIVLVYLKYIEIFVIFFVLFFNFSYEIVKNCLSRITKKSSVREKLCFVWNALISKNLLKLSINL